MTEQDFYGWINCPEDQVQVEIQAVAWESKIGHKQKPIHYTLPSYKLYDECICDFYILF